MSEFQYYEFQALDRPLTQQERAELRAISSRAEITATSFTNEYNWGNLKADPAKLVERYFDAHFYLSNWGSRTLILRFPVAAVPVSVLTPYTLQGTLRAWSTSTHTLVEFNCNEEDIEECWEDQNALADLIPLRQQIISLDLLGFCKQSKIKQIVSLEGGSDAEEREMGRGVQGTYHANVFCLN